MKLLPILAAAAAATLAIPAANAANAAAAPAAPAIAGKADIQHHRPHHKRPKWRTVCKTKWHHGHRQRVCRKVRVR